MSVLLIRGLNSSSRYIHLLTLVEMKEFLIEKLCME